MVAGLKVEYLLFFWQSWLPTGILVYKPFAIRSKRAGLVLMRIWALWEIFCGRSEQFRPSQLRYDLWHPDAPSASVCIRISFHCLWHHSFTRWRFQQTSLRKVSDGRVDVRWIYPLLIVVESDRTMSWDSVVSFQIHWWFWLYKLSLNTLA